MKKIIVILIIVCFGQLQIHAQQSNLGCMYDSLMAQMICGSLSIQGDPDNICNDGVHLWVEFTPGSTPYVDSLVQEAFGSTDSYKVVKPLFYFEPQTSPVPVGIYTDDIWSQVINLPFKFCFFGNKYDQIVVGANGAISFDLTQAGMINWYSTIGWPALPYSNAQVNNAIFCPYHDIDPSVGGTITYSVEGVAPCRKFIVTWNAIPMYDCFNQTATQQIVLTEGAYRIDMNIIDKPVCPTWLNGAAYMGIQNAIGTAAFTPPGYNGGQWTANNESWSFIPIGKQNLDADTSNLQNGIYWVDSATNVVIGVGDTLHYWPLTDTTIYVFFGDSSLLNDTNYVAGNDTLIDECGKGMSCSGGNPYIRLHVYNPNALFTYAATPNCAGADVQFTNASTGASSFHWDFGDGASDTSPNPSHTYLGTGPFNVTLVAYGLGCNDTLTLPISFTLVPVAASFTLSSDSVCGAAPIYGTSTSTGNNLSYSWNMGDNTTYSTSSITHSYAAPGSYPIWLVIEDTLTGCKDSSMQWVYVDDDRRSRFDIQPPVICIGESITLDDSITSNVVNYYYEMGNGDTLFTQQHQYNNYKAAGDYTITLHTDYLVCGPKTETTILHIDSKPIVNLGEPEEICTGRGGITISDLQNPGAQHAWSTGASTESITVNSPGTYKLTVTNGACQTNAEKIISPDLDCIFIPTAFSPNGDGRNDYFKPIWYDANDVSSFQMAVYNRYGQMIFSTEDKLDRGWDGTFKGQKSAVDTYMYLINVVSIEGKKKVFKGDVTLVR